MKWNPSCFLLLTVIIITAGCAPLRYSQFSGNFPNITTSGTMVEQRAIPVYRGWPDKPYIVIGSIRFQDPNAQWNDGDTARAAHLGKTKGGDAIIMRVGSEFGVGLTTGAANDPSVFRNGQVSALVIKWKPESEIAAEQAAINKCWQRFETEHPELTVSKGTVALVVEYVSWLGIGIKSDSGEQKAQQILDEILIQSKDDKSSKWLLKGTVRSSSLTSSWTDVIYGIALINQKDENITIVSSSERIDVNFSGTMKDGQVRGQLGVSAGGTIASAKAEGVMMNDKISITSQGQTADGTFQGSFTFSR
jgi:hypothetical protein